MVLMMTALMVFAVAQLAQAVSDYEIPGGISFSSFLNKKATGTKLDTTLAIHYEPLFEETYTCEVVEEGSEEATCVLEKTTTPIICDDGGPMVKMSYSMRVRKGSTYYPFGGSTDICYFRINGTEEDPGQLQHIKAFIGDTVIPMVTQANGETFETFDVKDADEIIQDDEGDFYGCCVGQYFVIMNLEITYK